MTIPCPTSQDVLSGYIKKMAEPFDPATPPTPPRRGPGGRPKGVPNKTTTKARARFLEAFRRNEVNLDKWLGEVANGWTENRMQPGGKLVEVHVGKDPAKAAELMIRMAEYHFPKLGRLEHVGEGGGALQVIVRKYEGP